MAATATQQEKQPEEIEEPEEEAVPYEPDFSKKPVFANGLPYQNLNMDCGDEKVYFYKKFSLD